MTKPPKLEPFMTINPDFVDEAKRMIRNRSEYRQAFEKLARFIHESRATLVFLEGQSTLPTWEGVNAAWKRLFPQKKLPAKILIPSRMRPESLEFGYWLNANSQKIQRHLRSATVILTDTVYSGNQLARARDIVQRTGIGIIKTAAFGLLRYEDSDFNKNGQPDFFASDRQGPFFGLYSTVRGKLFRVSPTTKYRPPRTNEGQTRKRFFRIIRKIAGQRLQRK